MSSNATFNVSCRPMAASARIWPAAKRSTWPRVRPELANVLGAALRAVEPGQAVRRSLAVETDQLVVGGRRYALAAWRRVLVVGAGKASAPMAVAVEEVLDGLVRLDGSVTVQYG